MKSPSFFFFFFFLFLFFFFFFFFFFVPTCPTDRGRQLERGQKKGKNDSGGAQFC